MPSPYAHIIAGTMLALPLAYNFTGFRSLARPDLLQSRDVDETTQRDRQFTHGLATEATKLHPRMILALQVPARTSKLQQPCISRLKTIAIILGFSLLPDLDVIPGLLAGNIPDYHNQISHSFGFGLMLCMTFALLLARFRPSQKMIHIFFLAAAAYSLHLIMDFFTYGRGVMLAWPLTSMRFLPPFPIFYGVRHSEGLFSAHHLITLATESLTLLPFLIIFHHNARKHPQQR